MEHLTKPDNDHICGRVLLLDNDKSRITYLTSILEFVDYSLQVDDDINSVEKYLKENGCCTAIMLTPAISDEDCQKLIEKLDKVENPPALFMVRPLHDQHT